tara:strand:- start:384 stop:632 length:249 start_codon:yes stop_codon:yes gene_type:complete
MKTDSWKRPIPVEDNEVGYTQQTKPHVNNYVEATPEEFAEWQEKELNWWADRQLNFVAIATVIQISALAFMGAVMYMNSIFF